MTYRTNAPMPWVDQPEPERVGGGTLVRVERARPHACGLPGFWACLLRRVRPGNGWRCDSCGKWWRFIELLDSTSLFLLPPRWQECSDGGELEMAAALDAAKATRVLR